MLDLAGRVDGIADALATGPVTHRLVVSIHFPWFHPPSRNRHTSRRHNRPQRCCAKPRCRLTTHCSGLGVSRCAPSFSPLNSISLGGYMHRSVLRPNRLQGLLGRQAPCAACRSLKRVSGRLHWHLVDEWVSRLRRSLRVCAHWPPHMSSTSASRSTGSQIIRQLAPPGLAEATLQGLHELEAHDIGRSSPRLLTSREPTASFRRELPRWLSRHVQAEALLDALDDRAWAASACAVHPRNQSSLTGQNMFGLIPSSVCGAA